MTKNYCTALFSLKFCIANKKSKKMLPMLNKNPVLINFLKDKNWQEKKKKENKKF